jgi:very-short-patch-repair endonuclease
VVSAADAAAFKVTRPQLRRLVRAGVLEKVACSVFRFAGSGTSWHQSVLIAVLDGGPECVASHRTAAALHAFDGFEPGPIEVLVPMHVFHRRKDVIVHHTRALPEVDRARVGPIPVTSRARTLIDLGAVTSADRVEEALDSAERDGAVKRAQVAARYAALRAPGRNGIGAMTQVLRGRLGRVPRSVLERRMLRVLARAGLPTPVIRHWVILSPTIEYELDFAYLDVRLGLESDGHGAHATRRQRAADNVRQARLEDAGWRIRRFTYEQVMYEPSAVVAMVRSALRSCSDENSER